MCRPLLGKTSTKNMWLKYEFFPKASDPPTLMQALLDFTLSSREALQKAVVFLIVSVTGRVLFPVHHAEAASSEAVSVLWVGGRGKIGC